MNDACPRDFFSFRGLNGCNCVNYRWYYSRINKWYRNIAPSKISPSFQKRNHNTILNKRSHESLRNRRIPPLRQSKRRFVPQLSTPKNPSFAPSLLWRQIRVTRHGYLPSQSQTPVTSPKFQAATRRCPLHQIPRKIPRKLGESWRYKSTFLPPSTTRKDAGERVLDHPGVLSSDLKILSTLPAIRSLIVPHGVRQAVRWAPGESEPERQKERRG